MVMVMAQRPRALGGRGGGVWVLRCHEVKIRSTRAGPLVHREWVMLTAATICRVGKVALADLDKKPTPVELSCFGFAQAALRKTGRDMDLVKVTCLCRWCVVHRPDNFPGTPGYVFVNTPMDLEPGSLYLRIYVGGSVLQAVHYTR